MQRDENSSDRPLNGLVLAAGQSRRMGEFKPLLPLRGRTVIENTVDCLLAAGAQTVVVVLGHRAEEVEACLRARYDDGRVRFACNRRYAETDMLASVREGLAVLPPCRAFFLLPGDMPLISAETCRALARALPEGAGHIVFPLLDGRRAHPPLIGADFIEAIRAYDGPDGLRGFWRGQEANILTVPVSDCGCAQDLDTPEQYRRCLEQLSK